MTPNNYCNITLLVTYILVPLAKVIFKLYSQTQTISIKFTFCLLPIVFLKNSQHQTIHKPLCAKKISFRNAKLSKY